MGSTPSTSINSVDSCFGRPRNGPCDRERKWGYRPDHRWHKNQTVSPKSLMFWSVLPSINGRYLLKKRPKCLHHRPRQWDPTLYTSINSYRLVEQEIRYPPKRYRSSLEYRTHNNRTDPPPARYISSFDRLPSDKHYKISSIRQDCLLKHRRP